AEVGEVGDDAVGQGDVLLGDAGERRGGAGFTRGPERAVAEGGVPAVAGGIGRGGAAGFVEFIVGVQGGAEDGAGLVGGTGISGAGTQRGGDDVIVSRAGDGLRVGVGVGFEARGEGGVGTAGSGGATDVVGG